MATQYTSPYTSEDIDMMLSNQALTASALNNIASRPQKSFQQTTTTATTAPVEFADMLARRNQIGAERAMLNEALKQRERGMYGFADALAQMPAQQGAGSWLGDFARGFGSTFNARANAAIGRAERNYKAAQEDLATALAFDKAMGEVQRQTQVQDIDYRPVAYNKGGSGDTSVGSDTFSGVPVNNFGRSVGYDPVEHIPDYGYFTRAALDKEQLGLLKHAPMTQSGAKAISDDDVRSHLLTLHSGISDNILSGRVLDFVGKAGGIRVADTPAEQEFIFGPIRNYQEMDPTELKQALSQARNNFVASGLNKAQRMGVPVSAEELKNWFNSAFSMPDYMQTESMYNVQDKEKITKQAGIKSTGSTVADWDNDDWWNNYK